MQAFEEKNNFHEKSETFDLTVTLQGEKLTIVMMDFTDWAIYSKEYTNETIGKEIRPKRGLRDVFAAFTQLKSKGTN